MESDINNILNKAKKSRMTSVEKARMQLNIMSAIEKQASHKIVSPAYQAIPLRSPYFFQRSIFAIGRMSFASAFAIILILGGLSYASADSLPGDFLYSVKTDLIESIEEKITFTPEKKVALRQKRIEDRFSEIETLIKEKRITPANRSIAETEIQLEKEKISASIEEVNKDNPEIAKEVKEKVESNISARLEKIDVQIEENIEFDLIQKELESLDININTELDENISSIDKKEEVKTETKSTEQNTTPISKEETKIEPTIKDILPIKTNIDTSSASAI
ncbi:MAG: DUF5667 domain-containing protein [Candidatus Pacebacteria bacterium]|nr:DUF5667 domain-containing protein [Candidatus Paceibacterota bacterium]MCF7862844.1 DUF5667 domain-containing protein [Candidatus Paceibacterota bacterium]